MTYAVETAGQKNGQMVEANEMKVLRKAKQK